MRGNPTPGAGAGPAILQLVNRFVVNGIYCIAPSRFFIAPRLRGGSMIG
jgi:hypothetical protein